MAPTARDRAVGVIRRAGLEDLAEPKYGALVTEIAQALEATANALKNQASKNEIEPRDECPSGKHQPMAACPTWTECLDSGRWNMEPGVYLVWGLHKSGLRSLYAVDLTQGRARAHKRALEADNDIVRVLIEPTDANHLFLSTVTI